MRKLYKLIVGVGCMGILGACQQLAPRFELLSPAETGIHFSNRISETDSFNILYYEYIYNGGGVGIADFDQNGWPDVFFSGNMVDNQLYLNEGDFRFKAVGPTSGISASTHWSAGVTVIDINADGWMDLYVCATTYAPGPHSTNLLFVNQGNDADQVPVFAEMGEAYGIAEPAHTTQAAWLDYDRDGDLDLFLAVNQMDARHLPNQFRKKVVDGSSIRTDKLFRNDYDSTLGHPVFTDVSQEAGILIEGFSLGVTIVDINLDDWPDIYVSNDYLTNDLLYINQGDGRFIDEADLYFKHTSYSAMGNDVVDINHDGLPDIVALDMLPADNMRRKTMLPPNNYTGYLNNERYGYQYQYGRNTLQLNQGFRPGIKRPVFSEVAMLAGVSATDWSWAPLVADFDLDGDRDLIVTNGFPKDVTDRDFIEYSQEYSRFLAKDKLLDKIPSVKIRNYAFENQQTAGQRIPVFRSVGEAWGIHRPSFSNGAAYADLDLDGDLDYVVNNINDSAFVFRNHSMEQANAARNWLKVNFEGLGQNPQGLGAKLWIYYGDQQQYWENTPYRGYMSSMEPGAYFGLGSVNRLDSLVVSWPSGRRQVLPEPAVNRKLLLRETEARKQAPPMRKGPPPLLQEINRTAALNYVHVESDFIDFNVQRLLLHKLSQYGPALAAADVNNDGLDDVYIGGSHFNKGRFFIQQANGQFTEEDRLPGPDGEAKFEEELGALFFDADQDGDPDLYLVSGGSEFSPDHPSYQDRLFLNDQGQFSLAEEALPKWLNSGSCVKAADFDRDGDLDLFVGGRVVPEAYPQATNSHLLLNDGAGNFSLANESLAPALHGIGMVCDALWTDFDQDGWVDLMLAGEWMPLQWLKNDEGKLVRDESLILPNSSGWWSSLLAADFDQDGDMDYVAGNLGLNSLLRASPQQTLRTYAADFNGDGSFDYLPAAWFPDTTGELVEYPFFGRSDMEKQIIQLRGFYTRHDQFGQVEMQQLLNRFPSIRPLKLEAQELKSVYVENLGQGQFDLQELPLEAQLAPVNGLLAKDLNQDGYLDLVLVGNDYGTETGMGRYDAFNGLVMLGTGESLFQPLSLQESGFYVPGDAKSLIQLSGAQGQALIMAGENRGPLRLFRASGARTAIPLQSLESSATIHLQNGRSYREELPYGHSFLSQSSRKLWLPARVRSVEIFDYQGNSRTLEFPLASSPSP